MTNIGTLPPGKSKRGFEVWGITGGIATGKSTAAKFFAEEGISVIDADEVSRELSAPGGAAHKPIVKRFGTDDRMKLRNIVFADPKARQDLEAILHPLIQMESFARMQKLASTRKLSAPLLYEAALLVETGRYKELDGLIVVEAPREMRIARLLARDGASRELAERIIDSQISDADRRSAATAVIENSGTLQDLHDRVRDITKRWAKK